MVAVVVAPWTCGALQVLRTLRCIPKVASAQSSWLGVLLPASQPSLKGGMLSTSKSRQIISTKLKREPEAHCGRYGPKCMPGATELLLEAISNSLSNSPLDEKTREVIRSLYQRVVVQFMKARRRVKENQLWDDLVNKEDAGICSHHRDLDGAPGVSSYALLGWHLEKTQPAPNVAFSRLLRERTCGG